MNRRSFLKSSGGAGLLLASGAESQPASAFQGAQHSLMKLGDQTAPTNDVHLKYLARYAVRNICGYPQIANGRLYATVDELKRMAALADQNSISVNSVAPPFL